MHTCVAFRAQGDQILFLVATGLATKFEVMYLQVLHATAVLASPAVALQHLPMQCRDSSSHRVSNAGFCR